jgi:hypothetical protein
MPWNLAEFSVVYAAIEIFLFLILSVCVRRRRTMLRDAYPDTFFEELCEEDVETLERSINREYDRTVYRKLELIFILFHFPTLVVGSLIGFKGRPHPVLVVGGTYLQYLLVLWLFGVVRL